MKQVPPPLSMEFLSKFNDRLHSSKQKVSSIRLFFVPVVIQLVLQEGQKKRHSEVNYKVYLWLENFLLKPT